MTLKNIMTQIANVEMTIDGIKRAYDQAPPAINQFPCFINFPEAGEVNRSPSLRRTTHTIKLLLYVTKGADLPSAESELRPYYDKTMDAFDTHLTLFGFCSNSQIVRYAYGVLSYAGQPYLGISFDLSVVEWTPFTFSA